jgi:hypothetical protein
MRPLHLALMTGALAAAGCSGEPTGVLVVPAFVTWVEWPAAVTATQPGSLRVSGYTQCPYRVAFHVSVSGTDIRLVAEGRDPLPDVACIALQAADAGGAGYDTLLPLPRLTAPPSGLPAWFLLSAPMAGLSAWPAGDQVVGGIELQATADTATQFAGRALVFGDSAGCWWMRPWSRAPTPLWVFTKPVRLVPQPYSYSAFVSGRIVPANPPICGESSAVHATRLEVDATPWGARLARSR